MKKSKERVVFYAFTSYQLYTSLYYAVNVHWNPSVKKYLIFYHVLHCQVDLDKWEKFFDEIIIIRDSSEKISGKIQHLILRCLSRKYLYLLSKIGRQFNRRWRNDNIFICFSDLDAYALNTIRILKKHTNNFVCLVEEGDATYSIHHRLVQKSPVRKFLGKLMRMDNFQYIGQTGLADVWIVRHPGKLPKEKRHSSGVIQQGNIFANISSVFDESIMCGNVSCLLSSDKKRLLWISGPVDEFGISETEELKWLSSIAVLVKERYTIFIKRHPRERIQKYNSLFCLCNVQQLQPEDYDWVPVEILVKKLNPETIITIASSAAFHFYEMGLRCKIIYTYRHFKHNSFDSAFLDKFTSYPNIYSIEKLEELHMLLYSTPLLDIIAPPQVNHTNDIAYLESLQF